jgi:antitoxin (DNA-binding transcriptional repressor) of toxin-antitoxin stability system
MTTFMEARKTRTKRRSRRVSDEQRPLRGPLNVTALKKHCLQLVEQVSRTRRAVIITKRKKAIARLEPIEVDVEAPAYGCMAGSIRIVDGDPLFSTNEPWDADAQ